MVMLASLEGNYGISSSNHGRSSSKHGRSSIGDISKMTSGFLYDIGHQY
jgi:hypothetical protein